MATAANLLSFDEYLNTSYSPDCEYIDGVLQERNVGRGKHSFVQGRVYLKLSEQLGSRAIVLPEQRTRISPTRVRIPDVCVVAELEEVTTKPPLLCVEVLSPDDRWNRVIASVGDYQLIGVPCVWVIDPYTVRAWIFETDNPPLEVKDGKLAAPGLNVEVNLAGLLP